jgi:SPW repeat
MPRGPIPLRTHAMVEPVVGILFIAAPWIFGFSDVGSSKTLSIIIGVIILLSGMTTRWRWSIAKLVPLRMHFMTDVLLGIVAIAGPFILGDSDSGAATRFLVIMGVLELLTACTTNWDLNEEIAVARDERNRTAAAR